MKALLPAFFLGLLTIWTGTFPGGATFEGAVVTHGAVLVFCLLAGSRWRDPLSLGRWGRLLPGLLLVAVAASWWASPVERAGRVGLVLLPAFLLIPAAVAECWKSPTDRRRGLMAVGLLLAAVAGIALLDWRLDGYPKTAMPLGHHNLLAGWLVLVWPLALPLLRDSRPLRFLTLAALALAAGALAGTGSLFGVVAVVGQLIMMAVWWRPARRWILALALVCAATQLPRATRVLSGGDVSTRARAVYYEAGWSGALERPGMGWGPGSVPWTVGRFMEPEPGVSSPNEVVGDLHSLPLHLLYELGSSGLLLGAALVGAFLWQRTRERNAAPDPELLDAALVSFGGGLIFALGNAPVAIPALLAAAVVSAGAALSAASVERSRSSPYSKALPAIYAVGAVILLAPLDRAHHHYQKAITAVDQSSALDEISEASGIDPGFPLYRARAAWLAARAEGPTAHTAEQARIAAEQAPGLAPLWLAAGTQATEVEATWARDALEQAWQLDPTSGWSAFGLLTAKPNRPEAVDLGVQALRTEPRFAAAVFWETHPRLWQAVREELEQGNSEPQVRLAEMMQRPLESPNSEGARVRLALTMDETPAVSFSLYAFRRSPWPTIVAEIPLRASRLSE